MNRILINKESFSALLIEQQLIQTRHAHNIQQMIHEIRQINQLKRQSSYTMRFQSQGREKPEIISHRNGTVTPAKVNLCVRQSGVKQVSRQKKLNPINITETDEDDVLQPVYEIKRQKTRCNISKSQQQLKLYKKENPQQKEKMNLRILSLMRKRSQPKITLPSLKQYEHSIRKFTTSIQPLAKQYPKKPYIQPIIVKHTIPVVQVPELEERLTGWSSKQKEDDALPFTEVQLD